MSGRAARREAAEREAVEACETADPETARMCPDTWPNLNAPFVWDDRISRRIDGGRPNPGPEWWQASRERIIAGETTPAAERAALRREQDRILAERPAIGGHRREAARALGIETGAVPPVPTRSMDVFRQQAYPRYVAEFLEYMASSRAATSAEVAAVADEAGIDLGTTAERFIEYGRGHMATCPVCREWRWQITPAQPAEMPSNWGRGHRHPGGMVDGRYVRDAHSMTFDDDEPLDAESIEFEAKMAALDDDIARAGLRIIEGL